LYIIAVPDASIAAVTLVTAQNRLVVHTSGGFQLALLCKTTEEAFLSTTNFFKG
jgi:hypothetical protein